MVKFLPDLLPIADPTAYKLHFARHNGIEEPVDVLLRSCEKLRAGEPWTDWHNWQAYRPHNNEFNRDYVFTLARYERPDLWLFGGIFRIVARCPRKYVVELTEEGKELIGRLILHYAHRQRQPRVKFEKHYRDCEVQEILREPSAGRVF
ncbi:MAG: hypothetical protein OXC18_07590 [Desulfurellaceae bacterium]|nr:hypothetical protein [Desulfurellaceae bacterium]